MSRRVQLKALPPGASAAVTAPRRWEYLEVDVHVETWSDNTGRAGRLPIGEAGPGKIPSVVGVLNELGGQGWELAGVSNSQSPMIYRMLLKRRSTIAR